MNLVGKAQAILTMEREKKNPGKRWEAEEGIHGNGIQGDGSSQDIELDFKSPVTDRFVEASARSVEKAGFGSVSMHTADTTGKLWSHAHRATRTVMLISPGKPVLFSIRGLYKEPSLRLTCKGERERPVGQKKDSGMAR